VISDLTQARDVLLSHGLVGGIQAGWLMLGTGFDERSEIRVFENVFVIRPDGAGWMFARPGPGQLDTEVAVGTLDEAVDVALIWVRGLSV
jgi:hypothetical protein